MDKNFESKIDKLSDKFAVFMQEMQNELSELKVKIQENKNWSPRETVPEFVYHISFDGRVHRNYAFDWAQSSLDKMHAINNIFKSEEEAEFEVERRKVIAEVERMADGVWSNDSPCYSIVHYTLSNNITIDAHYSTDFGVPIFSSRDKAQECVDRIGEERLKKYYFRIVEE